MENVKPTCLDGSKLIERQYSEEDIGIYVDALSGNDEAPGTINNPVLTFERAMKLITHHKYGATIYIKAWHI